MTLQYKSLGKIGPIRIGGGFSSGTPFPTYNYPKKRLSDFLNFKSKDANEIFEFCSNYQLLFPSTSPQEIIKLFLKEQAMLRKIAYKLRLNELDQSDLDNINKRLKEIKFEVRYPAKEDSRGLSNANDAFKEKFKSTHIIVFKKYPNNIVGLWEDFVLRFIEKQDIKECLNCGDYFTLISRHKREYCDKPQCKNTYNKRKGRLKNQA